MYATVKIYFFDKIQYSNSFTEMVPFNTHMIFQIPNTYLQITYKILEYSCKISTLYAKINRTELNFCIAIFMLLWFFLISALFSSFLEHISTRVRCKFHVTLNCLL